MLACASCSDRLHRSITQDGVVFLCRSCGGRAATVPVLRRVADPDFLRRLRHKSAHTVSERSKACPQCARAMGKVDFGTADRNIILDVCPSCQIVWFDRGEYAAVTGVQTLAPARGAEGRAVPPPPPPAAQRPPRRPATTVPRELTPPPSPHAEPPGPGDDRSGFALTSPDHLWQMIPAIFGLPIEYGPNRLRDKPAMTWGLVGIMAAVFALLVQGGIGRLQEAIDQWGLIPSQWTRHGGLTLFTSFFLHASWWHLIGNAYFLLIFGDNVEDHLGRAKFLVLVFVSHLFGSFLQAVLTQQPDLPCVGASAGIAGVIAYYAIVFPRAKIGIFLWLLTLFRVLRMPAIMGLLLFTALQLWGVYMEHQGAPTSVAYLAHLGGLAVGAVVGMYVRVAKEEY